MHCMPFDAQLDVCQGRIASALDWERIERWIGMTVGIRSRQGG